MPTTTNFGFRYPAGANSIDVVTDLQNLATDIDTALNPKVPFLARQTLGGSAASVTFSSIPSAMRSLRIRWTARGDAAVNVLALFLRINGDTSSSYNSEHLNVTNTTVVGGGGNLTAGSAGIVVGSSGPAGAYASGTIDIVGWDSPHSSFLGWTYQSQAMGTGGANFQVETGGVQYFVAGPYTSLSLSPSAGNFVVGSDFQIEGWPT